MKKPDRKVFFEREYKLNQGSLSQIAFWYYLCGEFCVILKVYQSGMGA